MTGNAGYFSFFRGPVRVGPSVKRPPGFFLSAQRRDVRLFSLADFEAGPCWPSFPLADVLFTFKIYPRVKFCTASRGFFKRVGKQ